MVGIYKITSPSGKIYIGQSWGIKGRWNGHKYGMQKNHPLKASINKYGIKAHKFEVIHELPPDVTQEVLNTYECIYMDAYRDCGVKLMNIKEGGSNGKLHPETRAKISKANKGRPASNKGVPHSEEHKKKIGEAGKGRKASPLMVQKLIERNKSKKGQVGPRLGHKMPEHVKEALQSANKGRKLSPESIAKREAARKINRKPAVWSEDARKKMSERMKGKPSFWKGKKLSPEAVEKGAAKKRGVKQSPETIAKRAAAISAAYAKKRLEKGGFDGVH